MMAAMLASPAPLLSWRERAEHEEALERLRRDRAELTRRAAAAKGRRRLELEARLRVVTADELRAAATWSEERMP